MVENKVNWWLIVGVAVIVGVIASLITANITGNVIKLNQDRWGKYQIYTKQEVDNLFLQVGPAILRQFNNQVIKNSDEHYIYSEPQNCNDICGSNYTCINGVLRTAFQGNTPEDFYTVTELISCSQKVNIGRESLSNNTIQFKFYELNCGCR